MSEMSNILLKQKYNLKGNLDFLRYDNEDEWHELRQKGIGGSDIGAIMELNEYTSPLMIYKQKVGEDNSDHSNIFTKKGKDLESFIRDNYVTPAMKEKGYSVEHPEETIINNEYPWLRANIDGIAVPFNLDKKSVIIEIKFVSQFARKHWDNKEYNGVPASYYAQVQEYMLVTDLNEAYICALFDDKWEFKMYHIIRDEVFLKKLYSMSKDFYEFNMQMRIPPKPNVELDKEDFANELDEALKFEVDPNLDGIVEEYRDVSEKINELTSRKNSLTNMLKTKYAEGYEPQNPKNKYKVMSCSRTSFDSLKLGNDYPNLYQAYLKETLYTVLKLK